LYYQNLKTTNRYIGNRNGNLTQGDAIIKTLNNHLYNIVFKIFPTLLFGPKKETELSKNLRIDPENLILDFWPSEQELFA